MKKLLLSFFTMLTVLAIGQTNTIKGQIHDKDGVSIPFATLATQKGNTVYADKDGKFSVEANKGDTILISAVGYSDFVEVIAKSQLLNILLEKDKNQTAADLNTQGKKAPAVADPSAHSQFEKDQISFGMDHSTSNSSLLAIVHQNDETRGSPYLFDKWVKGYVINTSGAKVANDSYLFNFDKMSQNLLMTQDKINAIEVDRATIQSFNMNTGNKEYIFENRDFNNAEKLFQVMAKNENYTFYKTITTKFERANYTSNGLTESGHNYDLYIDKPTYYIFSSATKQLKQVDFKKKALKEALPQEQPKIDIYFSGHAGMEVNEDFVIDLINSLN